MANDVASTFLTPRGPDQPDPGEMLSFDRAMNRQLSDYLQQIVTKLNAADLTDGGAIVGDLTLTGDFDLTGDMTFSGTITGPMLRLTSTTDASLSSTGHAFQIGASNAANIIVDSNEIMARNNGAASTLNLNVDGGNVSIGASSILSILGGQLLFPATQNPSADANTLDDYEEGTWTPTFLMGGGSTGLTYTHQLGRYTKIGRTVHWQCDIQLSAKGSSTGAVTISGLPFGVAAITGTAAVGYFTGWTGLTSLIYAYLGGTSINLVQANGAATGITAMLDTTVTNTSRIIMHGTYTV